MRNKMSITQKFNKISSINFSTISKSGKLVGCSYNISLGIQTSKKIYSNDLAIELDKLNDKIFVFNYEHPTNTTYSTNYSDIMIDTPFLSLCVSGKDLIIIDNCVDDRAIIIQEYIETLLKKKFNIGIVNCQLDTKIESEHNLYKLVAGKFRVVYDFNEGSLSWLEAERDNFWNGNCSDCKLAEDVLFKIVDELNESIVLNSIPYPIAKIKDENLKIIRLNENATPENLLKYIVNKNREILIRGHIKNVSLSTGLRHQIVYDLSY